MLAWGGTPALARARAADVALAEPALPAAPALAVALARTPRARAAQEQMLARGKQGVGQQAQPTQATAARAARAAPERVAERAGQQGPAAAR